MSTGNAEHPFARTLGPGPYTYIGFGQILVSPTTGACYTGPKCERGAGTCAHCGMGITNIYVIRTGEGRQFGVGSDCIEKASLPYTVLTQVRKAKRAHQARLRDVRKAVKGEAARSELIQLIKDQDAALTALPHPNYPSKTLKDYALFIVEKSGHGGMPIALTKIKDAIMRGVK